MTGEVTPQGNGDEAASPLEFRASHEDRDRVVEVLRVAAGDGRLTAEELDERLEAALTARTYGELAALTKDLPPAPGLGGGALATLPGAVPEPKELVRIEAHSSAAKRDGQWVVPKRMEVKTHSGNVTLDFTQAVITQPDLAIEAEVSSGLLTLITKPGVMVETDDVANHSGVVKVQAPWDSTTPVILRIQISGTVRSGQIVARPPRAPRLRRTFWQWLLRRPRPMPLPAPDRWSLPPGS